MTVDSPKISAIVRTKNSSKTLSRCLESLQHQTILPTEIIVVDSGSTDHTLEIAEQAQCRIVHYPTDIEFNYSKALNLGIKNSLSDYLLIVSSHVCLKYNNTVELMLSFLSSWKQILAISTLRDSTPATRYIHHFNDVDWRLVNRQNFQGQGMYNFCSLIRKEDWQDYKFNESIPRCEDQDWVWHFYRERNAASIVIWHPTVFYDNPYYNPKKDAWDYITLGHHIDRYFVSKAFLWKMIKASSQNLREKKFDTALHNLLVVYYILLERLKGMQVRSTYNDLQEKGVRIS